MARSIVELMSLSITHGFEGSMGWKCLFLRLLKRGFAARTFLAQDSGTQPCQSLTQPNVIYTGHVFFCFRQSGWIDRRIPPFVPFNSLNRPLFQLQTADAFPAQMRIDPVDHNGCQMLQLKREAAFDTYNKTRWFDCVCGVLVFAARRPLQLERLGGGCDALAGDLVPVKNNIGLPEALPREDGIDDRADKIGQRP